MAGGLAFNEVFDNQPRPGELEPDRLAPVRVARAALVEAVRAALADGVEWSELAGAVGTSEEAVQEMYRAELLD